MTKLVKNKLGNFLLTYLIFLLTISWLLSGWPRIWKNPSIPPNVKKAEAATERQSPDGVVFALIELTGAYTDVDDDPDSPDGNWLLATNNKVDTTVRASFPTPTGNPTIGANLQEFRVLFRQYDEAQTGTPTARIELWETGGVVALAISSEISLPVGGVVVSLTWDATLLGTADGSAVEVYAFGFKTGGGPGTRNSVEVGAIEWNVDYSPLAPTFTQNDSRWYWNADSVQPGGAMANENTTSTNATSSAVYRIRMNITIGTADLTTSTQAFKLQYGTSTTGCPAVPSWSDVGGLASGVIWRGYDNTGTDEEATTTSTLLGSSNVRESYEEANPSVANLLAIANGQDGEWDWVVQNNNAPGSTTYCFRMIKSNSTLLDGYNADGYPAIVTEAPSLSCSVTPSTLSFGTLTTSAVSETTDTATTTISSGSAFYLTIHDWGDYLNATSGLYAATGTPVYNIASATNGRATSTLSNGVDGYGIKAATTTFGSGGDITTAQRYNKYYLEGFHATNAVGGLQTTSTAITIASSTVGVTTKEIVVTHKAAVSGSASAADYKDTILYTCGVY